MGDENRGVLFAQFVHRHFPFAKTVLDVAGGKGNVARKLANKGHTVIVVDAKPRFEGNIHKRITYKKGWFTDAYNRLDVDVVVGMHPDEATGEIIRYAVKYRLPFAVVPCCIKGRDASGVGDYHGWLNKLKSIAVRGGHRVNEYNLHMRGKNVVIYGIPE